VARRFTYYLQVSGFDDAVEARNRLTTRPGVPPGGENRSAMQG